MAVKAITLQQPWASLIALGAKSVETRSWSTAYRGPLAIHAGKKWYDGLVAGYQLRPSTSPATLDLHHPTSPPTITSCSLVLHFINNCDIEHPSTTWADGPLWAQLAHGFCW
jgi:hypothetical protein